MSNLDNIYFRVNMRAMNGVINRLERHFSGMPFEVGAVVYKKADLINPNVAGDLPIYRVVEVVGVGDRVKIKKLNDPNDSGEEVSISELGRLMV